MQKTLLLRDARDEDEELCYIWEKFIACIVLSYISMLTWHFTYLEKRDKENEKWAFRERLIV